MFEVDLNNGVFREIDLSKPVYCAACGKEIHGNTHGGFDTCFVTGKQAY